MFLEHLQGTHVQPYEDLAAQFIEATSPPTFCGPRCAALLARVHLHRNEKRKRTTQLNNVLQPVQTKLVDVPLVWHVHPVWHVSPVWPVILVWHAPPVRHVPPMWAQRLMQVQKIQTQCNQFQRITLVSISPPLPEYFEWSNSDLTRRLHFGYDNPTLVKYNQKAPTPIFHQP